MANPINKELAQWLRDRRAENFTRDEVHALLIEHHYAQEDAERATAIAFDCPPEDLESLLDDDFQAEAANQTATWIEGFEPTARIKRAETQNSIPLDHGAIKVVCRSERPYVIGLANVLTAEECHELIEYSRYRISRAMVVSPIDGSDLVDDRRTSELVMLSRGESPLIAKLDERIAQLTGIPSDHGEGLQVMRYGVGAEYAPHYDYFAMGSLGERRHLKHGQRVATLVIYLNDVEAGGETIFPYGDLSIAPQTGHASYFAYTDEAGRCDAMSFHGGAPVKAGEKWIATMWIRDRPYVAA
ncbi:2-oxoglutarate-dependent dioxygenase [Lysobacter sp. HDW10]|uniref:2OG-Fe(II) oxygenase n=1 Tax=Lysobacter sp. HDW10 TaxID=2714936 RepID=UPI00140AFD66|nr:2OG-Fe(II) oxygenase [Lysobacter sp. HDW10]QIK80323.1 2-oxoglutarate-dependent dioxygenase [Lysobacter sp. HDW10]